MQVRLLVSFASPETAWAAGDLFDCDEATAGRMIAAGFAVPTSAGPAPVVVESAMAEGAAERAMKPRAVRRKS